MSRTQLAAIPIALILAVVFATGIFAATLGQVAHSGEAAGAGAADPQYLPGIRRPSPGDRAAAGTDSSRTDAAAHGRAILLLGTGLAGIALRARRKRPAVDGE
jgi:hypothetical protein